MIVDVAFAVRGDTVPADHGYLLYGAITSLIPELHRRTDYAIHPLHGRHAPGRLIALTRHCALTFRLDHELIPVLMPLSGASLELGDRKLRIGVPMTRPLLAADRLTSRLVVIKGYTEPDAFVEAANRQVAGAGVTASVDLIRRRGKARFEDKSGPADGPVRRTIRIAQKEIVGFALKVTGLSATDSIHLQQIGVGGRQRFGCGVLVPSATRG